MKKFNFALFFLLLGIFPLLGNPSSPLEIIALDGLTVEGSKTFIEAKVYTRNSHYEDPGVRGKMVVFRRGGAIVGRALTDSRGMARIEVPAGIGVQTFEARLSGNSARALRSRATLYALNPNKPIIVTDIDGTISKTPKVDLTTIDNGKIKVIKGSRAMLNALSKDYQVVYVSGRYDRTFGLTKKWVNAKGFPKGPVLLSPELHNPTGVDFKTTAMGRLKKLFPKIPFALGDRAVDMKAYSRSGVKPILLGSEPRGDLPRGTVRLREWSNLPVDRILAHEGNPFGRITLRNLRERAGRTVRRERNAFGDHLGRSVKEMPKNLRFALMATFLAKLAEALDKGDGASLEQFFDEITNLGFYKAFGLFYAGEAVSGFVFNRYLTRFVKPKVVRNLLKSNLQYSAALALPLLAAGNIDAKTFVIDMAVFRVVMGTVNFTLKGLEGALKLKRLENLAKAGTVLGRFAGAAGWVYQVGKVALVIYISDKVLPWIHKKLTDSEVKGEVAKKAGEMFSVLSDPKASPEEKKQALNEAGEAYQAYRNYLIRELAESSNRMMAEVSKLGRKIKGYEMSLAKFEEIRKKDPKKYANLSRLVDRVKKNLKKAYEKDTGSLFDRYFSDKENVWKRAYEAPRTGRTYVSNDMTDVWAANGALPRSLGDPYGDRTDLWANLGRRWAKRSFNRALKDLPENRLEVYRSERSAYRLALAITVDKTTRKLITDQLNRVKKMETMDTQLYEKFSSGSSTDGFLNTLKKTSQ